MSLEHVPCWIYRSPRQEEMYLYLAAEGAFDCLPHVLLERFGTPEFVMQLKLHPGRHLARLDVADVMAGLRERGYHLQLPPEPTAFLYRGD